MKSDATYVIARGGASRFPRHCEERSDVAIYYGLLRCARNDGRLVRTGRTAWTVMMDSPVEPGNDRAWEPGNDKGGTAQRQTVMARGR